jgi:hypothetical protein
MDYWKKYSDPPEKKAGFIDKIWSWYSGLSPYGKIMVSLIIVIIVGALVILALPTIETKGERKGLPSLLITPRLPSLLAGKPRLPSLITKAKPTPITGLESYMCSFIYQYNITNTTLGKTTCFKNALEYDCICITEV